MPLHYLAASSARAHRSLILHVKGAERIRHTRANPSDPVFQRAAEERDTAAAAEHHSWPARGGGTARMFLAVTVHLSQHGPGFFRAFICNRSNHGKRCVRQMKNAYARVAGWLCFLVWRRTRITAGFRFEPMPQFVAFLRAVNVGGRTVKMERLRALFASRGYANVKTFIASGNVIFNAGGDDCAQLETEIERSLRDALGFEVATFVRSMLALAEIAAHEPFPGADADAELFVGFLKTAPAKVAQSSVLSLGSKMDEFHFRGRELYWLCRTRVSDSPVSGALLERKLGMAVTIRNSRTVRKIAASNPSR